MPEYFLIIVAIFIFTAFLHYKYKVKIYKSTKQFLLLNLISIIGGFLWFHHAAWRGHWVYNDKFLLGIKVGYSPIEDLIGILAVTYFCLTIYKILEKK